MSDSNKVDAVEEWLLNEATQEEIEEIANDNSIVRPNGRKVNGV